MTYEVVFAPAVRSDLLRLYDYLLDRSETAEDLDLVVERAPSAIETAVDVHLFQTPFIYREAAGANSLRRELIIPFGATGYVALHEITQPGKVVVLAVRHQWEEDYH